ncbi:DUF6702 family protein [uncultured Maribacter sp.]|uniref:DUF6702 family protein n=1 Tax=uncultured Maribacter sp. TaxID=431308 RepID=UPI002626C3ED|nr:DUF6702 family protein [uncultured Maribacter sp.]
MKIFRKIILVLVLPLLAFSTTHKYYISVTNITYSQKDKAIQVTSRVFIDDINAVLEERYGVKAEFGSENESVIANEYLEKYFKTKFILRINGEDIKYNFLGKKYEDDLMVCYLEVTNVKEEELNTIEIQNEVLIDMYNDQQNIIHFKIKGQKKSVILIKENNKGMLNF